VEQWIYKGKLEHEFVAIVVTVSLEAGTHLD
jgi:hypothetical protein